MKPLCTRFLTDESFAIGVLAALGLAIAEAVIGDGLTTSDLPTIAAMAGVGAIAPQSRKRRRQS